MIDPRKCNRVEFIDFHARFADFIEVMRFQRTVVRSVAESIEEGTDFNSFLGFLLSDMKQEVCNGIITEIEIFQMNTLPCLPDGFEHVVELLLSGHQ